jgi:hypothetical protein
MSRGASRVQENVGCRPLGRFGQAFFQSAAASFRSAVVRITQHDRFRRTTAVAPHQIAGFRFPILELRSRYRGVAEGELDQNTMRGQVTLATPKGFASESAQREMSLKARNSRVSFASSPH